MPKINQPKFHFRRVIVQTERPKPSFAARILSKPEHLQHEQHFFDPAPVKVVGGPDLAQWMH